MCRLKDYWLAIIGCTLCAAGLVLHIASSPMAWAPLAAGFAALLIELLARIGKPHTEQQSARTDALLNLVIEFSAIVAGITVALWIGQTQAHDADIRDEIKAFQKAIWIIKEELTYRPLKTARLQIDWDLVKEFSFDALPRVYRDPELAAVISPRQIQLMQQRARNISGCLNQVNDASMDKTERRAALARIYRALGLTGNDLCNEARQRLGRDFDHTTLRSLCPFPVEDG